ncbi:MAG: squalene/phytoene synthase family protein [Alphaproteobacteria bacterium]|nr:squalene/phytoene synthase family protein [Alphaproteobacteria bacterium]
MKTQKQENFPVACYLFPKHYRTIITNYYNFARYCDDIADSPSLSLQEKKTLLDNAERSLFGQGSLPCATLLRENFLHEHFDFSLATDLLIAFRRDINNEKYQTWGQLLNYCQYSAAPVGRFMLALFNENPSTYLPASALCSVLQIVNHVQDLGNDIKNLNRIYLPQDLLKKFKVSAKSLHQPFCSKNLHFLLNDVLTRCKDLLKDAEILPTIVKSMRLRIYLCVVLALTNILIKKLYNSDVLASPVKLSKYDWVQATFIGLKKALLLKQKTLS